MYERESGRHWVKGVEVDADLDLAEEDCDYGVFGDDSMCIQMCGSLIHHPHFVAKEETFYKKTKGHFGKGHCASVHFT
jgi:hypothetical protein|tara:strand:+ start:442 stop:675 length:234 start_codon:yes stop_codon:yes gene_type:complete